MSCSQTDRQPPHPVVARVLARTSSRDEQARIRPALTPAQAQTSASSGRVITAAMADFGF